MGNPVEKDKTYTFEEYLELEKVSEGRLEYIYGEIYALAGSSKRHNKLQNRIWTQLDAKLDPQKCQAFTGDLKIEISPKGKYLLPDLVVSCNQEELKDDLLSWVKHPILIMEVLSNSTEDRDRNEKFKDYTRIPSLKYYLLVSQYERSVELYARQAHDFWHYTAFHEDANSINLDKLDVSLDLNSLFEGISFE